VSSDNETLLGFIGAIILLLWGTRMIRIGVLRGYGGGLRTVLGRASSGRFKAAALGTVVGVALQSSTATALIAISFLKSGALTLVAALAIMLGADLGASIAVQLFTANVSQFWGLLVLAGYLVFMIFYNHHNSWRYVGRVLIGLGLVLLALRLIGASAADIRESTVVNAIVVNASSNLIVSIAIGTIMAWLMYSSLSAILLVASLAATGVAPAAAFFGFVLGVNIGAALPAITTTVADTAQARRVPLGNLLFRILGVLIIAPLLGYITPWVIKLSEAPISQIVNLHLLFNIGLCVVMLAFVAPMAKIVSAIYPDNVQQADPWAPRNLDESSLQTPAVALGTAARETLRMGDAVEDMLIKTMLAFEEDNPDLREQVVNSDDYVDSLHEAIKLYLTRLSREELDPEDSQRCVDMITFTTNLEHVGDIVEKNLMNLAAKKWRNQVNFSEAGLEELRTMHQMLLDTTRLSLGVFMSQSEADARTLLAQKDQFRELELEGTNRHLERLRSGHVDSIQSSALHLDMVRDFKRINSHLTSVSYPILSRAGALRTSRLKKT